MRVSMQDIYKLSETESFIDWGAILQKTKGALLRGLLIWKINIIKHGALQKFLVWNFNISSKSEKVTAAIKKKSEVSVLRSPAVYRL